MISKEDAIALCGLRGGIRLFNRLHPHLDATSPDHDHDVKAPAEPASPRPATPPAPASASAVITPILPIVKPSSSRDGTTDGSNDAPSSSFVTLDHYHHHRLL